MKVVTVAKTALVVDEVDGYGMIEESGYQHNFDELNYGIDILHEAAGRGCYQSWSRPNPETATNESYLGKNIIGKNHQSVFEHGSLTFWVSGVSRNLLLELERHRFLSYSVRSTRYVDEGKSDIIVPGAILDLFETDQSPELTDIIKDIIQLHEKSLEVYKKVFDYLTKLDFPKKKARETARTYLLGGTETSFFVTANIRAWREVIQKRYSEEADREIRDFAELVLGELKKHAPNSVQDL